MASGSSKVVLIAFLMNLGIALTKFVAFAFTGSSAMLAEAVHSLADTSNQIFLFLGIRKSAKEADARHPFGYGKAQYLWSFMVAILIFSLGGLFSLMEAWEKIMHPPEEIHSPYLNLIILSLGVVLESISSYFATREFVKLKGNLSTLQYLRKTKDQVLITVLFEDYAALFGLAIALLGTIVYMVTGWVLADTIATFMIGILLGVVAVFLYREASSLLIGESATDEDEEKIKVAFKSHPKVIELKELLTMHLSANQILVNAHVKFQHNLQLEDVEDIIDEIEEEIVKQVPAVYKIFIETHQKESVSSLQQPKYDPGDKH